jgi:RNA polymerase sigma-70 factor, ECF subfamily
MNAARDETLASGYESARTELTTYATRLLASEHVAQEVVQQAAVRMLESESAPTELRELRAWLFRVVTNLGLDYLRKHSTWRETMLVDAKALAGSTPDFVANSRTLAGSPEMRMVAAEHLVVCFSCTLRNLKPEESAALLMKEVYGFTVEEVAETIGASFAQVKNWIQSRARLLHEGTRKPARWSLSAAFVISASSSTASSVQTTATLWPERPGTSMLGWNCCASAATLPWAPGTNR